MNISAIIVIIVLVVLALWALDINLFASPEAYSMAGLSTINGLDWYNHSMYYPENYMGSNEAFFGNPWTVRF